MSYMLSRDEDWQISKMLQLMTNIPCQGRGQAYVQIITGQAYVQNATADSNILGRGQASVHIVTWTSICPRCYSWWLIYPPRTRTSMCTYCYSTSICPKMLQLITNIRVTSKDEDKHISRLLQYKHMSKNVTADYEYTSNIQGQGQAYVQIVTAAEKKHWIQKKLSMDLCFSKRVKVPSRFFLIPYF